MPCRLPLPQGGGSAPPQPRNCTQGIEAAAGSGSHAAAAAGRRSTNTSAVRSAPAGRRCLGAASPAPPTPRPSACRDRSSRPRSRQPPAGRRRGCMGRRDRFELVPSLLSGPPRTAPGAATYLCSLLQDGIKALHRGHVPRCRHDLDHCWRDGSSPLAAQREARSQAFTLGVRRGGPGRRSLQRHARKRGERLLLLPPGTPSPPLPSPLLPFFAYSQLALLGFSANAQCVQSR